MMRALFSGVSGLKVHQTKMDVIGNNIANVNTAGFKSSSVVFSDILYQKTQGATGPSADSGRAGQNPKQIGLGSNLSSITTNITGTSGSERTDNPFDLMINGDAFFIVNVDGSNYFTKSGAFKVDASGTLCTATGARVMGWQPNETETDIIKDTVSPLQIMSSDKLYADPEPTTEAHVSGNIDERDPSLSSELGAPVQVSFFDKVGNSYNIKMNFKETATPGTFEIAVSDIVDDDNKSIFVKESAPDANGNVTYSAADNLTSVTLGGVTFAFTVDAQTGAVTVADVEGPKIRFNTTSGKFISVAGGTGDAAEALTFSINDGNPDETKRPFTDINIDFSKITKYAKSKKCTLEGGKGTADGKGIGAGKKVGEMIGLSVDTNGMIYGSYDNGTERLLGQIAVTTFANPSGLEAVGNSMFTTTQNSGDFDGIGKEPTEGGGSLTPGVLEMSNVDLSAEFTSMITTQRGFQANSRIITTSDTLLEELINLKR